MATLLGLVARLSYVLAFDFPLNDGGLFVVMTRDLIAAGLGIPLTTTYNDLSIPFAYPPLGFYLAAAVAMATGVDLVELFRWLPTVLSAACVPAFALLARALLQPTAARGATYAYALIPAGFAWPIMGGGLTRSLGLLFALLALAALVRVLGHASRRGMVLGAVLAGLTALSHPHVGAFLALSAVLVALARCRSRAALARFLLVDAGAIVIAAPWWLTVVARHGIDPLVSAAATGIAGDSVARGGVGALLRWNAWDEPLFPIVSALALAGVVITLSRRELLLPLWIVALAFALPGPFQMLSSIPLALLAGIGVAASSEIALAPRAVRIVAAAGVGYLTVASILAFVGILEGLPLDERIAMKWVAERTPPSARVLVVTTRDPGVDAAGEWLPALGLRPSVLTTQGTEWVPGLTAARTREHKRASECAESDGDCLARLAADGVRYDYVYLASEGHDPAPVACCTSLARALRSDPRYSLAYEGGSVVIFVRR